MTSGARRRRRSRTGSAAEVDKEGHVTRPVVLFVERIDDLSRRRRPRPLRTAPTKACVAMTSSLLPRARRPSSAATSACRPCSSRCRALVSPCTRDATRASRCSRRTSPRLYRAGAAPGSRVPRRAGTLELLQRGATMTLFNPAEENCRTRGLTEPGRHTPAVSERWAGHGECSPFNSPLGADIGSGPRCSKLLDVDPSGGSSDGGFRRRARNLCQPSGGVDGEHSP